MKLIVIQYEINYVVCSIKNYNISQPIVLMVIWTAAVAAAVIVAVVLLIVPVVHCAGE